MMSEFTGNIIEWNSVNGTRMHADRAEKAQIFNYYMMLRNIEN